jgi:molybdopterin synthase catalytic subunit/molybdopterin converting factor small subunit
VRATVRCFALLRELAVDRCELALADEATIDDAWRALAARYPAITPHRPYVRAARDGAYAPFETRLVDGDIVAFLPPVSGGGVTVSLTDAPIDAGALESAVAARHHGGVVVFIGRARDRADDGRTVIELEYEAYPEMAVSVLTEIAEAAAERWSAAVGVVHRVGLVPIGEAAVVIVTATAHRSDAYAANREVIEAIKERLPIWKRERFADGSEWKRPGA